jgi:hypothetical protein
MTPTACRLLKGYLLHSAWLYSAGGLMQFLLTDFYWREGFSRVSVPAALLGLWGIAAAINGYNLVWRSLPLANRDASIFRWWAIAGAPGIWLTLCDSIAWVSEQTSPGVSAPPLSSLLQSILLGWAVLGVAAAAPTMRRFFRGRLRSRVSAAFLAGYALWLIYGVPAYSASPAGAIAVWTVGAGLLAFSGVEAARGKLWRWPDIASGGVQTALPKERRPAEARFGINAILIPLLRQTLVFALEATAGMLLLYWFFPGAVAWLFWIYFISISTAGFLLTYQVRSAIPILRSLPLSTRRLAVGLQVFGAIPGIATLALALLVNVAVLHVKLDPVEFATFALIVVASQALPIPEPPRLRAGTAVFVKWIRLLQRVYLPFYIGIVVLNTGGAWARLWWFKWPLIAAGVVLCLAGYHTLVRQLRTGIRPASNESAFSAR